MMQCPVMRYKGGGDGSVPDVGWICQGFSLAFTVSLIWMSRKLHIDLQSEK